MFQVSEEVFLVVFLAPAGVGAGVAHGPFRNGFDQQRVVVTVHENLFQLQVVAALFALVWAYVQKNGREAL